MKAPDKIYLVESDNKRGEVASNFASSTPFRKHGSIAYIRKDALLEWAESLRKTHLPGQTVIRYLIDKLNSM